MFKFAPPSDCQEAREAVSARLDGELSELDAARLDVHLRQCAACQAFAADVVLLTARVRLTPLEPAPAGAFTARRRRFGGSAAAVAAVAALLVAAAAPSFLAGKLYADHASGHSAATTTVAQAPAVGLAPNGVDRGIVAVLLGQGAGSGRIIPV